MRLDEILQQPTFDKQTILAELAKLNIKFRSTINVDGSVDVQGDVRIPEKYTEIPVQFRNVNGDFFCNHTQLTSLKGSPVRVGSAFHCNHTQITSLQYAPQHVGSGFSCSNTGILSLLYAPTYVGGNFACSETRISSLQYAPQHVGGDFRCMDTHVESLQYAPQYVGGDFLCHRTNIMSLHNIHKTHSNWVLDGVLYLNRHCTHLLGLAYIKGVKRVQLGKQGPLIEVLHDVFEWQEKLLELGLVEQAQL
jgi:hypothetical protein